MLVRALRCACLVGSLLAAPPAPPAAADTPVDDALLARSFAARAVRQTVIDSAAGRITIAATDADTASVHARRHQLAGKHQREGDCQLTIELAGDVLQIASRALRPDSACEVDFELALPAATIMTIALGTGDLTVNGMRSALNFQIGFGNTLLVKSVLPSLDGRTGAGNLNVTSSELGQAKVKIGAGSATIALSRAPAGGRLEMQLGTGDAEVALPRTTRVRSSFRSSLGTLTNEFGASATGYEVAGSAGIGDLKIRKL